MKWLMAGKLAGFGWLAGGAVLLYTGARAAGQREDGISVVMLAAIIAFGWAFVCTMTFLAPVTGALGDLKWPVVALVGVALAWLVVQPNPGLGVMLLLVGSVAGVALAMGWRLLRG